MHGGRDGGQKDEIRRLRAQVATLTELVDELSTEIACLRALHADRAEPVPEPAVLLAAS